MNQPVIILAGAGMSAESGLPTYRGVDGIYPERPQDTANPFSFRDDPNIRQAFKQRRQACQQATPHKGYEAVAALPDVFVVTTNVDGLFAKAGVDPKRIWEVHGNLHRSQCQDNCSNKVFDGDVCPDCELESRPNVALFYDPFFCDVISREQRKLFDSFLANLKQAPLVVEVGCGEVIPTLRLLGAKIVFEHGGELIRINKENGHSAEKELLKLFK